MWALKNLDSLLKIVPFMSVKYIQMLKTMKGVYVRWLEIIEEFMFVVIYAKVPTRKDYQLEREYESDPEPTYNLENLAKKEASLAQRAETMWQLEDGTELCRSSRVVKPTQRMEQYCQQQ